MHVPTIGFYGKYIPLQGVDVIVKAAAQEACANFSFELIGNGQTFRSVVELHEEMGIKNVTFIERLPYEELMQKMRTFDVSLGIFGITDKALRVIPNKVYDAAALGLPIITARTPAIEEVFTDEKDILLCEPGNPVALAEAVVRLMHDSALRKRIAHGARATYENFCTPDIIGKTLVKDVERRFADRLGIV